MRESTSNVEFAHRIHEQGHGGSPPSGSAWVEIVEAVVLAAVAILTAWSGYQAALWDARSSERYARATSTRVQAQEQSTLAGQDRIYDIATFNSWITAKLYHGDNKLAAIFERRFRPEYAVAFAAWLKTDPLRNPNAPPGPIFMPEYRSLKAERAKQLGEEATRDFERGVSTRHTGDRYVRVTVFLATVLLLTALSQRFRIRGPRVGILVVASVLLAVALFWIVTFPRA